jgi:8-oxo-dGTP pyrophosphatase MutT (NUDIX family)
MTTSGREQVVSSEKPFSGTLLKVRVDEVLLPSGRRSKREIVEHRGAVAMVALMGGSIILVRQYRHASGKTMLEIPAGTLEEGESPVAAAARELEEETGFLPGKLEKLAHFYVAVGYSTEVIHLYLATDLEKRSASQEEDEAIETILMPLEEAVKMVSSNEIEDAKTIIGLLMAKNRIGGR